MFDLIAGCDMAVFRKNLAYSLKTHPVYRMPEIAKEFVKGLEEVIEDPVRLKWFLLYTQVHSTYFACMCWPWARKGGPT